VIDIGTVSSIVTTASIVIGVVFTILEVRHLTKVRQTDVIMKTYDRFGSREIVEAMNKVGSARFESMDQYLRQYGFTDVTQLAVLFEGLGVLLEQGLINIKMVDRLFGPTLNQLWVRMKPVIYGMRESIGEPFFFSHFEYLLNKLEDYRVKTHRIIP
jgi:hypothetical protein